MRLALGPLLLAIAPGLALGQAGALSGNPWDPAFLPPCSFGTSQDSEGRGIEAGFRGSELRPRLVDEACYLRGLELGGALAAKANGMCRRDFERGFARGIEASPRATGTECFRAGYAAGGAALRVGAREGSEALVGGQCVAEHARGLEDGRARRVASPRARQPAMACYRAGHELGALSR